MSNADDRYSEDTVPWQIGQYRNLTPSQKSTAVKGYTSSLPLFDAKPAPIAVEPVDPSVLESDRPRLKSAARRVLDRLKQGPATNLQLMQPDCGGARFGGRLHDLRRAGVIWKKRNVEGAVWEYELISCPEGLS